MLVLSCPIVLAHFVSALIPFINSALCAKLGTAELAAAGLVNSSYFALMSFCWGINSAVGVLTAESEGQQNTVQMHGVLATGIGIALLLSIPTMLAFANLHVLWQHLGIATEVSHLAQHYFYGFLWAVPADLAKFVLFQYAIARNKPNIPLISNLFSLPVLWAVNTLLSERYGIIGIGYGTALTEWCVLFTLLTYVLNEKTIQQKLIPNWSMQFWWHSFAEQLRLGIPIGVMYTLELIFFMVFALIMGRIGSETLAAHQISMQWMWLTVMITYGFTEAITILVSQARGAKQLDTIRGLIITSLSLTGFTMSLVALVYWLAPLWIISLDMDINSEKVSVLHTAEILLTFCGLYQILDSMRIVISGALRGMADTQFSLWVNLFCFWLLGLPIGYFFAFNLHYEGGGMWYGLLAASVANIILQLVYLVHMVKKQNLLADSRLESPN